MQMQTDAYGKTSEHGTAPWHQLCAFRGREDSALCVKLQLKNRPRTPPTQALLGTRDSVNGAFPSPNFPVIFCHIVTWKKHQRKLHPWNMLKLHCHRDWFNLTGWYTTGLQGLWALLNLQHLNHHRSPRSTVCTMNHFTSTEITWDSTAGKGK